MPATAPELNDGRWVRACRTDEIAPGGAIAVPSVPPIAVFNIDGEFFATDGMCSHQEYSLIEGYIDGDVVECALHFSRFNVRSGKALTPPACSPLRTYEVHVSGNGVYVHLGGA